MRWTYLRAYRVDTLFDPPRPLLSGAFCDRLECVNQHLAPESVLYFPPGSLVVRHNNAARSDQTEA